MRSVTLQVPSRPIQNAGSALLSSICCVCVRYYTTPDLLVLDGKVSSALALPRYFEVVLK